MDPPGRRGPGGRAYATRCCSIPDRHHRQAGGYSFSMNDLAGLLPLAEHLVAQLDSALGGPKRPATKRHGSGYWRAPPRRHGPCAAAAYGLSVEAQGEGPAAMAALFLAALTFRLEQRPALPLQTLLSTPVARSSRPTCWTRSSAWASRTRAWAIGEGDRAAEKAVTLEPRRRTVLEALVRPRRRGTVCVGDAGLAGRSRRVAGACRGPTSTTERRKSLQLFVRTWRRWRWARRAVHHDRLLELLSETRQWKSRWRCC